MLINRIGGMAIDVSHAFPDTPYMPLRAVVKLGLRSTARRDGKGAVPHVVGGQIGGSGLEKTLGKMWFNGIRRR